MKEIKSKVTKCECIGTIFCIECDNPEPVGSEWDGENAVLWCQCGAKMSILTDEQLKRYNKVQ